MRRVQGRTWGLHNFETFSRRTPTISDAVHKSRLIWVSTGTRARLAVIPKKQKAISHSIVFAATAYLVPIIIIYPCLTNCSKWLVTQNIDLFGVQIIITAYLTQYHHFLSWRTIQLNDYLLHLLCWKWWIRCWGHKLTQNELWWLTLPRQRGPS